MPQSNKKFLNFVINLLAIVSILLMQTIPVVHAQPTQIETALSSVLKQELIKDQSLRIQQTPEIIKVYLPLVIRNYQHLPATGPDLSITKTDQDVSVKAGETITYQITCRNQGNINASGVVITETLPANTTFQEAGSTAGWTQTATPNQYQFVLSQLQADSQENLTFVVKLDSELPSDLTSVQNQVSIRDDGSAGSDPNTANNAAVENTPILIPEETYPDLSISLNADRTSAVPAQAVVVSIQYTNIGTAAADIVTLTADLPLNTAFDSTLSTTGWSQIENTSQYALDLGTVARNDAGSAVFAFSAINPLPAAVEGTLFQVVISDDGSNGADSDPSNNTQSLTIQLIAAPDLTITKSDGNPGVVFPGDSLNYQIQYNNTGDQDATGVVIQEHLPENTTFDVGNSSTGWMWDEASGLYSYQVGALASGVADTLQFTVLINETLPDSVASIANTAEISDDGSNGTDPNTTNNTTAVQTTLSLAPELSLSLLTGGVALPGSPLAFTLTYNNQGYQTATNVEIVQSLPDYTTFNAELSSPGWELVVTGDEQPKSSTTYHYNLATLNPGESGELLFVVNVQADLPQEITQITTTASIGSDEGDTVLDNNTATGEVIVSTGPTMWCGNITEDTIWRANKSPYVITCDLNINSSISLELEPGTIVKLNSSSRKVLVSGELMISGNENFPIFFTSYKDDLIGGDTNNNGDATIPAISDWDGIYIQDGGKATIDNAIIRYGDEAVNLLGSTAEATITNSTLDSSRYGVYSSDFGYLALENNLFNHNDYGVYVKGSDNEGIVSSVLIRNNEINNSKYNAMRIGGYSRTAMKFLNVLDISENLGTGNGRNSIELSFVIFATNMHLAANQLSYRFMNTTIPFDTTLTFDPGSVVKFYGSSSTDYLHRLDVFGELEINGTADSPVVFTSYYDDEYGGDTNGNGTATSPAISDWDGIYIQDGGKATIDNAIIRYGDESVNLLGNNSEVTITNSALDSSRYGVYSNDFGYLALENNLFNNNEYGVYTSGGNDETTVSSLLLRNNEINNSKYNAIRIGGYSRTAMKFLNVLDISENLGTGNGRNSIELSFVIFATNMQLAANQLSFRFMNTTIPVDTTLTFDPGSVVKFYGSSSSDYLHRLDVFGELEINGTADSPVVFTSYYDDEYGGDTNGNGTATSPAISDWDGIYIQDGGKATINNALIRYGDESVYLTSKTAEATITNSTLDSSRYGVYSSDFGYLALENNFLNDNEYGVIVKGSDNEGIVSSLLIRNNEINNSKYNAMRIGGYSRSSMKFLNVLDISDNKGAGNRENSIELSCVIFATNMHLAANQLSYRFMNTTIPVDTTLTFDPGSVVKLYGSSSSDYLHRLDVFGELEINGTTNSPVVFTSYYDDEYGGDTNGDGTATNPEMIDWDGIYIQDGGKATINHAIIRYGNEAVNLLGSTAEATIINSILDSSRYGVYSNNFGYLALDGNLFNQNDRGVYINSSNSETTVSNLLIRNNEVNNSKYNAIRIGGPEQSRPLFIGIEEIKNNFGSGNGENSIYFYYPIFLGNNSLMPNELPYRVMDAKIPLGSALTIAPGSCIKSQRFYSTFYPAQYGRLNVFGELFINGTPDAPVIFTSLKDDEYGGDTNGDGTATTPASYDWHGIYIQDGGKATINHAIIRYGDEAVNLTGSTAEATITNSTIELSNYGIYSNNFEYLALNGNLFNQNDYGINITGSYDETENPSFILCDNEFRNNTWQAAKIGGDSDGSWGITFNYSYLNIVKISNNFGFGNGENSIYLFAIKFLGNSELSTNELPYHLMMGSVTPDSSLNIEPGVVIKQRKTRSSSGSYYPSRLVSYGQLKINGTATNPVIFTSLYDDEYSGDTNSDGNMTTPDKGDWGSIFTADEGKASINYAIIKYGGGISSCVSLPCTMFGMIEHNGQELILTNSELSFSLYYGVNVKSPNHFISNNSFENLNSSYEAVRNGNIDNILVRAENNYWGDSSGPSPIGIGEKINYRTCIDEITRLPYACEYYVDAIPWIGQDVVNSDTLIDEELPDAPIRNTAAIEPGIPYIEWVKSDYKFFYFGNETRDQIEFRVDWNGSEEGRGEPGTISLITLTNTYVITDTSTMGGSHNLDLQDLPTGFTELKIQAVSHTREFKSEWFLKRITRFEAPEWMMQGGLELVKLTVTEKPDYSEAKIEFKIPPELDKVSLGGNDKPIVSKLTPLSLQLKVSASIRSDGYGTIKGKLTNTIGFSDNTYSDYDYINSAAGIVQTSKTSLSAYTSIFADGKLILQSNDPRLKLDSLDFGAELGGKIAYRDSILTLIPSVGQAVIVLSNIPGTSQIVNAIYYEAKIEPSGKITAHLSAEPNDSQLQWESLTASPKVKITLTTGVEILKGRLEANIYGGGEIEPQFCLLPDLIWDKTDAAVFVGAELKVLSLYEHQIEEKWELEIPGPGYGQCNFVASQQAIPQTTPLKQLTLNNLNDEEWRIETPDYGISPYAQFNNQSILMNSPIGLTLITDNLLVSNLYKSASPALAIQGTNAMLMWVHDDLALEDSQSKELLASTWNGSYWSNPVQVTNNQFVDFDPQVEFIDETHVIAIWQQIKDAEITDNTGLTNEIAQKVELVYAIYDLENNIWSSPVYLTDNSFLDHSPKLIVAEDGTVMVVWIQNANGQIIGDPNSPDLIKYAVRNGNGWVSDFISPTEITAMLSIDANIISMDQGVIVISRDMNDDLNSLEDTELFYSEWNGTAWTSLTQLTDNNINDSDPSISVSSVGEKSLIWLQDNQLVMLDNDWTLPPENTHIERPGYLLRNFETAMDQDNNIALIWQGSSEEGSDLFYSLYDQSSQSWLLADQLTQSVGLEKQVAVSFDGSGQLMIAYALDNVAPETIDVDGTIINNVMQYQSTDLHVLHYTPDSDLTLTNLILPYRPNPEPGETVLVRATMVNSGDWSIENPSVTFYDGDPQAGGVLIGTYDHVGYLTAGEMVDISIDWLVPADSTTSHTIFAIVDPLNTITEKNEQNNTLQLTTLLPDIGVSSVKTYYYDQYKTVPLAVITDYGKLTAENVLVQFHQGDETGVVIYSETIPTLAPGDLVAVSTEIFVDTWETGVYSYAVTVDVNDTILEFDETNNLDHFTLSVLPDLVIYAGDIHSNLTESGGPASVTVRNWGTEEASEVLVHLYEGPEIDPDKQPLATWTVPSIAVDGEVTVNTTLDHLPHHLYAIVDPENSFEELDESNNVSFEELPIVFGAQVEPVGNLDPNLADILYIKPEFEEESGVFTTPVQAALFDATLLGDTQNLCDVSALLGDELTDMVVLVEKGACAYDQQINNAATLGAVGVLVYNDEIGANQREVMTGTVVSIPAGFLARQDGLDLLAFHSQLINISAWSEAFVFLDPYH